MLRSASDSLPRATKAPHSPLGPSSPPKSSGVEVHRRTPALTLEHLSERLKERVSTPYAKALGSSLDVLPSSSTPTRSLPQLRSPAQKRGSLGTARLSTTVSTAMGMTWDGARNNRKMVLVPDAPSTADHSHWNKLRMCTRLDPSLRRPKLRNEGLPKGTALPAAQGVAADDFDSRYYMRVARAERIFLASGNGDPFAPTISNAFGETLFDVHATRFFVPELDARMNGSKPSKKRVVADSGAIAMLSKNSFNAYRSIWAPRARWSESKDLFDAEAVEQLRFSNEWNRARPWEGPQTISSPYEHCALPLSACEGRHSSQLAVPSSYILVCGS
jgi:hypothetical protein